MSESEFHDEVDQIYFQLEDQLDNTQADLDYEVSGGVMTITCEVNGSKVILSRQSATTEVWVAARSGGFHFRRDRDRWRCATGEDLPELLTRVLTEQTQEAVSISLANP